MLHIVVCTGRKFRPKDDDKKKLAKWLSATEEEAGAIVVHYSTAWAKWAAEVATLAGFDVVPHFGKDAKTATIAMFDDLAREQRSLWKCGVSAFSFPVALLYGHCMEDNMAFYRRFFAIRPRKARSSALDVVEDRDTLPVDDRQTIVSESRKCYLSCAPIPGIRPKPIPPAADVI